MSNFNSKLNDYLKVLSERYGGLIEASSALGHSSGIASLFYEENKELCDSEGISKAALASLIYNAVSNPPTYKDEDVREIPVEKIEPRYTIENGVYHFQTRRAGKFQISVEDADKIFKMYSSFGDNFTANKVRRKFMGTVFSNDNNEAIAQWHALVFSLQLYKSSNIFSPYTSQNTPQEEKPEMLLKVIKHKNDQDTLETVYDYVQTKKLDKIINDKDHEDYARERLINRIIDNLPEKEVYEKTIRPTSPQSLKEIVVTIADIHVGAYVKEMLLTPRFDSAVIEERLDVIAKKINDINAKTVTLAILGDLIESFTGLNHPNSWTQISAWGAAVTKEARQILSRFFKKIANLEKVYIIGGNHDRGTANNKEDRTSWVATIIFDCLSSEFEGIYDIQYHPTLLTHDTDNIHYIFTHGDKRIINNKDIINNLLNFGDVSKDKFNLFISGHFHCRKSVNDNRYSRQYHIPSIFSGNLYSEENGWFARPGFSVIYEDKDSHLPIITDYTLAD